MTRARWSVLCGLTLAAAFPAQGQTSHAGAGLAIRSGERVDGTGPVFLAARRIAGRPALSLNAELGVERLALRGSPQSCVLVEQRYCFGREDRLDALSSGLALSVDVSEGRRTTMYVVPLALGVRFSSIVTRELRGPTTLCFDGSEITSCPDNPPFEQRERATSGTWLSVGAGLGITSNVGPLSLDFQLRGTSAPEITRGTGVDFALLLGRRPTGSQW